MRFALLVFLSQLLAGGALADQPRFAVAKRAVPVFSCEAAAASMVPLRPDDCGQIPSLEFVALPETAFNIVSDQHPGVLEVTTSDYPTLQGIRLYASRDALRTTPSQPPPRARAFPGQEAVLRSLQTAPGTPYLWGGNLRSGVTLGETPGAYAGLDCSGLLYEATAGFTPRNTRDLVSYGKAVPVFGLSPDQIIAKLEPLDLIAWKGHVIIVMDRVTVIESLLLCQGTERGGVRTTPLRQRLEEVMAKRAGADSWPDGEDRLLRFVIRRWREQP